MAALPEGTPCWADAMFTDLEGAKAFYGDVLGWTFGESSSEFGNYTQAYSDGRAVAAIVPPMPGSQAQSAWCLYLASPDAAATAERIRTHGGEVVMGPMQVGDFGTMVIARDPGGVVFGVWQAGTHEGFEKQDEPGAYSWAEIVTREPGKADSFFPAVFPYGTRKMDSEQIDYRMFLVGGRPVLGRMGAQGDFLPPEAPSYVSVYFAVDDADAAIERLKKNGGAVYFGPMDSPFGRFAAVGDQQGAAFGLIDLGRRVGAQPPTADV
ncbi:VOC family protein [Kitasatospora aureofaciens]|uniref:Hydrolase n=1 Tax=Kitasatospora aureofaciens TaxID=1894 RepID=A0A1E7N0J6_KITAU|nr:VOC family protein [Kitasatospora aureofaciens]QEV00785.1 VOC family protein [Streptomyces viridifaciens]ARF79597.1 hydrolase [Kitasatospora aureofaciens]OEV34209.1 hydrolase [Kitasatospora aureofaciens]UKZ07088.1 VOC family protein [Streptomyces viridifaciens]GGU64972.1 hydrolase [Kitasatospora aureofaciens]